MSSAPLPLHPAPIRFGTDGWRGVLGVDITVERLLRVAAAAAQELAHRAPAGLESRTVVIGYDRRFLAPELAEAITAAVRGSELEPLLTETAVPTPACSWAVVERRALGALVITASHNPSEWLGLKIKGPFGGSVEGDFTAAVDETGRFCSTQLLMPLLIDHLARARQLPGTVVKTVSGSDLMRLVAEGLGREVQELPVGFKYIAAEMLAGEVLIGGEESGGVGFGMHLPERDALFAAMLVLEALVESGQPLGARLNDLQQRHGGASHYDRLDLRLADMDARRRLETLLADAPPEEVAGTAVQSVISTDGIKLRLGPSHWLMLRFSGTEPLLRLYCEAPDAERVNAVLSWARRFAEAA